jgi:hypothetical protein
MSMIRTQISLTDADRDVLAAAHRRTGRSMSALIRDAIHATYGTPGAKARTLAAIEATFGVVSLDVPGEALVEQVRSGSRLADLA